MNKFSKILLPMLVLATLLVSACAGAAIPTDNSVAPKVQSAPVEFTGIIESINGNEWTVSGKVITVDPSVLRDGPFNVGDTVKVEAEVQADGSMVVTRVEAPVTDGNSNDSNSNDANSNDSNTNDSNSNDDNGNDDNSNDDNSNDDNSNDDNSNDDNGNDDDSIDDNGNDSDADDDSGDDSNSNDDDGSGGSSNDDSGSGGDDSGGGNSNGG